jgi:hypothetical protein
MVDKELTDKEVLKIAGAGTKVMLYPDLYQYGNLDDAFGKCNKIILLYIHDTHGDEVSGHWCSLVKRPDRVIFYDSYGLSVDELLYKFKTKKERAKTNQPKNYLTTLLYTYKKLPIHYNEYKYQKLQDGVNTCGRYCAFYCRASNIPLETYQKIWNTCKKEGYDCDELITDLTNCFL